MAGASDHNERRDADLRLNFVALVRVPFSSIPAHPFKDPMSEHLQLTKWFDRKRPVKNAG